MLPGWKADGQLRRLQMARLSIKDVSGLHFDSAHFYFAIFYCIAKVS